MTDNKTRAKRIFHSLYIRLILVIGIGVAFSVGIFFIARFLGNYYIANYYTAPNERTAREESYINDLRRYVAENKLSSENTEKIARWSQSNRYVYLLVYKNDELFFSSDMLPEKPETETKPADKDNQNKPSDDKEGGEKDEDGTENGENDGVGGGSFGSGITVDYPTREELKKYAEENDLYELEMTDGVLFASVAEFTEYLYYDIANIVSLILAMVALSIILINYFRRILARIKKLDRNVMVVAGGDINQPILTKKGYDEITRLTENVENMRCTILESIEEERLAREANAELITAMSHDIRTPLTVLLGYLDIMKTEPDGTAMRSYVEASEKTAMRLKDLSDDLFNYFLAFGSTKENFDIEEYDAVTLFEQMLSEPLILLGENGYKLDYTFDANGMPEGSRVFTDAPKLMRIVDNIFSNISKYADKEYPIVFRALADAEFVIIEMANRKKIDLGGAESNGIGLKTCSRLASFIADGFEYSENDGVFCVKLTVKVHPPKEGNV